MAARSPGLKVVAPCPLRWDQLAGNDRVRFCGHCQQNVYNVASLTMEEAMRLIQRCEGRACMRLQRRADGTVITRDCFHVVRLARQRIVGAALGLAVAAAGMWTGLGTLRRTMEAWLVPPEPPRCPTPDRPAAEAEPEIPDWLRGGQQQQGPIPRREKTMAPRPKARPRPTVLNRKPADPLDDMGLMGLGRL
jgi:hypothetical protein